MGKRGQRGGFGTSRPPIFSPWGFSSRTSLSTVRGPRTRPAADCGECCSATRSGRAQTPIVGEPDAGSRGCSDSGDVGGEEVDAVSVEVAAGAVVMLGSAWVCMAGKDLGIT